MQPDDLAKYVPLLGFTLGLIMAIITGLKYINKKWTKSLDDRIDYCITDKVDTTCKELDNHESRIKSLEDRFKDFKDFFLKRE